MVKPIRVLVVDDHAIVREGICALLARRDDIEVVGEAADGERALEAVTRLDPDVVLMDIAMPRKNGLEATREIHARFPSTRVLVLTQHDNKEYILPLLHAGAVGYITKDVRATELAEAIRSVYDKGGYLQPRLTPEIVSAIAESSDTTHAPPELTEREIEVVCLIAEGLINREIAERLGISVKTVDTHRGNIMEKLNVHNTAELIKYATRKGIVQA
jgi:DNA-binding NarL/FixJ family response regulator